jgi:hypothetical protein
MSDFVLFDDDMDPMECPHRPFQVPEDAPYGGYGDHVVWHDLDTQERWGLTFYSVQVKADMADGSDYSTGYQVELKRRMNREQGFMETLGDQWFHRRRPTHYLDKEVEVSMGVSQIHKSPLPTLMVLIDKGWGLVALYVLRYRQDYGMTYQAAYPLAYTAVWGETTEERAEATPGWAMVHQTFSTQKRLGMVPNNVEWVVQVESNRACGQPMTVNPVTE